MSVHSNVKMQRRLQMDRVCVHARRKSRSAATLVRELNAAGVEAIRLRGDDHAPGGWTVLNFVDFDLVAGCNGTVINRPDRVEIAISKIATCNRLAEAHIPVVTITRDKGV